MTDPYERDQMPGVGQMLHRHKVTSPRWAFALTLGVPLGLAGFTAAALVVAGQIAEAAAIFGGAIAIAALLGFALVTFASARVAVSEGEIHVQLGFAGPKIPIAEVASVRLGPSGSNRVGMGVRSDLRGTTIMTMWGDNQRAVHIERTNGKKLVLVCKEPEAMVQAIAEAIARRDRSRSNVRVAEAEPDVEAESEADAMDRRARSE